MASKNKEIKQSNLSIVLECDNYDYFVTYVNGMKSKKKSAPQISGEYLQY